jgi:voltage-gated potassium channel
MLEVRPGAGAAPWRRRLHEIVFEADTPAGRAFDLGLLVTILVSVVVVILESVRSLRSAYGPAFLVFEWIITGLFTVEYVLRLVSVRRPLRFATSFYGIVDLAAVLPTYLGLLVPDSHYFLIVRALRLLRVFRILKLGEFLREARQLQEALRAARRKITVFLFTVLTMVLVVGALMYVVEGEEHGFVDIPTSIYWAIVTMTTVGYGDLAPATPLGKVLASVVMLMGYGILAVPTGIVTVEIAKAGRHAISTQACPACGRDGHDADAVHCKFCGTPL